MNATETLNLMTKAIDRYGLERQARKTQEECAELIVAISHYLESRVDINKVAAEVADVEIMIAQMRMIIGDEVVDGAKAYKLRRLAERLG